MKKTALAGGASLLALLMAGIAPARAAGPSAANGYRGDLPGPVASAALSGCIYRANGLSASLAASVLGPLQDGQALSLACDATGALIIAGGTGGGGSGSSAPSGTVGTAYPGTNAASPVFDALTGKGLLTSGGAVAQGAPNTPSNAWPFSEAILDAALQSAAGIKVTIQGTPAVTVAGVATALNQAAQIAAEQQIALATRPDDAVSSTSAPRTQTHDDQIAAVVTQDAASATALGTPGDALYSGTGSGTIDAIDKAVLAQLAGGLKVTALPALSAGPNNIGTVSGSSIGGYTASSGLVTPTLASTGAYAAGQVVGGLLTFPSPTRATAATGSLTKALVFFADTQTPSLDLLVFTSLPTSTITDHTTLSLSAPDNLRTSTVLHVSDCTATGTPTMCQVADIHREFVLPTAGGPLYGVLVARSAFTPASTTDVSVAVVGVSD